MNLQKIFFIQIQKTSPLKNNEGYSSKSKKILLLIFFLYVPEIFNNESNKNNKEYI